MQGTQAGDFLNLGSYSYPPIQIMGWWEVNKKNG